MAICYIAGAGPLPARLFTPDKNDFVIAADGGFAALYENRIRCDLVIGDFDSSEKPDFANIIELNPIKDDTDTVYAVKHALSLGYDKFIIYGALGGRIDMTLASFQTLTFLADHGAHGFLVGEHECATLIRNSRIDFRAECKGRFSVFSADEISKGVFITGAKYDLNDYTMINGFPIGVSNEFIGNKTSVSVNDGTLHIIFDCEDLKKAVYEC